MVIMSDDEDEGPIDLPWVRPGIPGGGARIPRRKRSDEKGVPLLLPPRYPTRASLRRPLQPSGGAQPAARGG